jgi:CRISPR-associated endonuclease Csn1
MVSCGQIQFMCLPHHSAAPIVNKVEFSSQNKMERALTGEMIKEVCIPVQIDRLGNIIKIG